MTERRARPILSNDGLRYVCLWRLPGGRWQVVRVGQDVEQQWVPLHELHEYGLTPEDEGDARLIALAPPSGGAWA